MAATPRRIVALAPLLMAAVAAGCTSAHTPAQPTAQPIAHAHPAAERLGAVRFATSCAPAVAPRFDRAVALLHSFEFGASIRAFNEVVAADSTCAMAHWGIALSRWSNPMSAAIRPPAQLAVGAEAVAAARRAAATRATTRERAWIDAVAELYADPSRRDQRARLVGYERAMAGLVDGDPADLEARIFHALALTGTALPTDKTYAVQLQAGRVLDSLWAVHPDHPGLAHYIIHTYDYPALAARASAAAQRYAEIAPSAAHALHMPSHTFTRVGQWTESAQTNRRSMDAALGTGSLAEALHAADYMMYASLQRRRMDDARRILDTLPALERAFDPAAVTGAAPGSAGLFALAAMPARWTLERRDWAGAAALPLRPTDFPYTDALVHFARALGGARGGAPGVARASVDSLATLRERLRAKGETYWAEQVAIQHLAAQAWTDHADGRNAEAIAGMRMAADREDATEKSAVTPGPLAPARELLGDLLLELGRPAEALEAYRAALRTEPGRWLTLDGARRAAAATGDSAAAARYAAELRKVEGG